MKILSTIWHKTAAFKLWLRIVIKIFLFLLGLIICFFPNPVLLIKQLPVYLDSRGLIQTDFPGLKIINQQLTKKLPPAPSDNQVFKAVEEFINKNITYYSDWDQWLNLDYWPPAAKVWQQKKEDCDGRAVLAVAILRARGYQDAKLVGNFLHIWVQVNDQELMQPMKEKNIEVKDGKPRYRLPSWRLLARSVAYGLRTFPLLRILLLLGWTITLAYHPRPLSKALAGLWALAGGALLLAADWARLVYHYQEVVLGPKLGAAVIMGLFIWIYVICVRPKRDFATKK
jgi:hypothetical protein